MRGRADWPKAKDVKRLLVPLIDSIVPNELHGAVKKYGYWRAGSIAGEAGGSLFVGSDGQWKDANPSSEDRGDLLDLIAKARGVSMSNAYEAACVEYLGYEKRGETLGSQRRQPPRAPQAATALPEKKPQSLDLARRIWRETVPIIGTPGERYLRDVRSITCKLPGVLRFHPHCPRGGERVPAMVALYTDIRTNEPRAIHRTFIAPDGSGKDCGVTGGDDKLALGPSGGCVIKLTPDAEVTLGLGISEGIETGLSLLSLGCGAIWAAGTAGTIKAFPVLAGIEAITIYADNDTNNAGMDAASACARRWVDAGREARIVLPDRPATHRKVDWNDVRAA